MSNSCIRLEADEKQIQRCKQMIHKQSNSVDSLTSLLSLAGNSVRFNILYLLRKEGRLCVCDLSDVLDISISAVSQHLRKLKDKNLISSVKEGQTIFYSNDRSKTQMLEPFFAALVDEPKTELA